MLALVFLLSAGPAFAQSTITVNANCSFADAITAANTDTATNGCPAGSGADTIVLTRNVELTANLPPITGTLTVDGRRRTVDGMDLYRIFNVEAEGVHLTVHDITLTQAKGVAGTWGSAVRLHPSSTPANRPSVTLNRVRISDSSAHKGGGASCVRGDMSISDSVISGSSTSSYGGGIVIGNLCALTVSRSAIHGNSAHDGGGGISADGQPNSITVTNSTIYNNSANGRGGGILIAGDVLVNDGIQLLHLTITGNSAGQADVLNGAGILVNTFNAGRYLRNSIIWGNTGLHQCNAVNGFTVSENNIIQASAGNSRHCGTASTADPRLPASPRGSIPYFALPDGSPAIGAAGDCSALTTEDQRGFSRPYPVNGFCDVGAYEWHAPAISSPSGNGGAASCENRIGSDVSAPYAIFSCGGQLNFWWIDANDQGHKQFSVPQVSALIRSGRAGGELIRTTHPGNGQPVVVTWLPDSQQIEVSAFYSTQDNKAYVLRIGNTMQAERMEAANGAAPAPPAQPQDAASATAARSLSNCMVTTTHILNFRAGPGGAIQTMVPYNVTLTAMARTTGWFQVDYHGATGWISADYVIAAGDCG